jgi:hypothetical protein
MKTIRNYILKITGSADIPPMDLDNGTDVEIVIKGSVVKSELADNQEGSDDKIYKVKMTSMESIK